jgi:hypothetical protein
VKIDIAELLKKYRAGVRAVRKRVTKRETIVRAPQRIARRRKSPPVPERKSGRTPTARRGRPTR